MHGYDDDGSGLAEGYRAEPRRGARREADPLDQRLDRWVSAGRQFVDGVAGARPGSRPQPRAAGRSAAAFRPADLGRWVEQKLDRLLEDDGDDWREPWQEQPVIAPSRRRPLEAISRRGLGSRPAPAPAVEPAEQDWPDDDSFSVPRWQRPAPAPRRPDDLPPLSPGPGRPLPRSSRRR